MDEKENTFEQGKGTAIKSLADGSGNTVYGHAVAAPGYKIAFVPIGNLEFPKEPQPWELIPNNGNDRDLIKLWCDHLSAKVIANRLTICERTVYNKVGKLRTRYPEAKIPKRK